MTGKVFALILLRRIKGHLFTHQRLERSEFSPGLSTTDCIHERRVSGELHRELIRGGVSIDLETDSRSTCLANNCSVRLVT